MIHVPAGSVPLGSWESGGGPFTWGAPPPAMALPGSDGKSARCPANSALCGLGQHHVSPCSKVYHRTMANSPLPVEAQWNSRTGGWGHSSPGHRRCHPTQARAVWGLRSAGCEGVWLGWDNICTQTAFLCDPHVRPYDSRVTATMQPQQSDPVPFPDGSDTEKEKSLSNYCY